MQMKNSEKVPVRLLIRRFLRRFGAMLVSIYIRIRARKGLSAIQRDGSRLGHLHYLCAFKSRPRLKKQIARLFETHPGDPRVRSLLNHAWRTSDRAVLEIAAKSLGVVSADEVVASVSVTGSESLMQNTRAGGGAILLGMHSGNVLAMLFKLSRQGMPISVVANQPRRLPDGFFENFFADSDMEVIRARPESRAFYRLNKAIKQGRTVYIPIDQLHKRGGIPTRFLGKKVPMPGGASALATRYGIPVYPIQLLAAEPDWKFHIGEAIVIGENASKERQVEQLAQTVEGYIRERPELWSWHQRRWMRYPFEDL